MNGHNTWNPGASMHTNPTGNWGFDGFNEFEQYNWGAPRAGWARPAGECRPNPTNDWASPFGWNEPTGMAPNAMMNAWTGMRSWHGANPWSAQAWWQPMNQWQAMNQWQVANQWFQMMNRQPMNPWSAPNADWKQSSWTNQEGFAAHAPTTKAA